jgi:UDP-N-acetylglucosamine diphosphorylase/glucosamine-1-phosphate N-acetyltransferase
MHYILFDDSCRDRLLPFTHTRPVADVRCGILTMRERWERHLGVQCGTLTEPYLQKVFPQGADNERIYINAAVFATYDLVAAIGRLQPGHKLSWKDEVIAVHLDERIADVDEFNQHINGCASELFTKGEVHRLGNVWDIFSMNDAAIRADHEYLTKGRKSAAIPDGVMVTGKEDLFIEEGARIYPGCVINASQGPVYIGAETEILEGSLIRGPFAACGQNVVKMGAKIYGATTLGPGCKVGGEINNVVFFANSNKAHDGYLGNAVIGEWCNLGADTNASNLKNNYDEVKIWDEALRKSVKTGLTFCGLFMGDHSKCGINTMFNTGTIVGVSCNIFGGGFPEKFIPSFSWGGSDGVVRYDLNRALETAGRMMARRGRHLTDEERKMYTYIFEHSSKG